jgi:hypothetical protein
MLSLDWSASENIFGGNAILIDMAPWQVVL